MALLQTEIPFRVTKLRSSVKSEKISDYKEPTKSLRRPGRKTITDLNDFLDNEISDESPEKSKPAKCSNKRPTRSVKKLFDNLEDVEFSEIDNKEPKKISPRKKKVVSQNARSIGVEEKPNTTTESSPTKSPRKINFKESDIIDALNANVLVRKSPRKKNAQTGSPASSTNRIIPSTPSKQILNVLDSKNLTSSPCLRTPSKGVSRTPKRASPEKCEATTPVKRTKKQLNFDEDEPAFKTAEKPKSLLTLIKSDVKAYQEARKALHTSTPSKILCRNEESKKLRNFLSQHLKSKKPGSLYVSGAPGTGKTACIMQLLQEQKQLDKLFGSIFINCMSVRQTKSVYEQIARELECPLTGHGQKQCLKAIEKKLSSKGNMLIIVLDEMDQLNSKSQELLYTIFEWPRQKSSRLILIGIANALDLTDRLLPRLHACGSRPDLLNFSPYSQQQILTILQERLKKQLDGGKEESCGLFQEGALQFCARKIAASTGDVRKALDTCRRALEQAEKEVRTQTLFKIPSPTLGGKIDKLKSAKGKIGLPQINAVLQEIYNSRVICSDPTNGNSFGSSMPLQQKLLLCSLILIAKHDKNKDVTYGRLEEVHGRVCRKRGVESSSDFLSLCDLIEARGLINIKKHKDSQRLSKISLKSDQEELEYVMGDKTILSAVLTDQTVLKKP